MRGVRLLEEEAPPPPAEDEDEDETNDGLTTGMTTDGRTPTTTRETQIMNTTTPIVAITDDARRNGKRNEVVGLELSNAQTGRNREESRMTMVTIGWRSGRRLMDGGVVVMNVAVMSAKEDAVDAVGAVEESLGTAGEDAAGEDAKAGEAVGKDAVDARRLILVGVEGM